MSDSIDDWEILRSATDSGAAGYEHLVRRHFQAAKVFAQQVLGDEQKAEDVVQKAFVNIYMGRDRFQAKARFRTFLFRVVLNLSINELKRKDGPANLSEILGPDEGSGAAFFADDSASRPTEAMADKELAEMIHRGLMKLPPKHRAALYLREYQQLSYAEIAEALDASLNEIKIWIHRARSALQRILQPYLDRGERIG